MPPAPARDQLNEHAYVVIMLRVVMDHQRQLKYGEIVDAAGQSVGWFDSWRGFTRGVQVYLSWLPAVDRSNRP